MDPIVAIAPKKSIHPAESVGENLPPPETSRKFTPSKEEKLPIHFSVRIHIVDCKNAVITINLQRHHRPFCGYEGKLSSTSIFENKIYDRPADFSKIRASLTPGVLFYDEKFEKGGGGIPPRTPVLENQKCGILFWGPGVGLVDSYYGRLRKFSMLRGRDRNTNGIVNSHRAGQ